LARPPDPPVPRPPSGSPADSVLGTGPPLSLAAQVFGDWISDAVRHAVAITGTASEAGAEAALVMLYRQVAGDQNAQARSVEDRLHRIQSALPANAPPSEVLSILRSEVLPILVLLDTEALRVIALELTNVVAQFGGRIRQIKAAQRLMERVRISPRATTVVQEEAEAVLAQLAQSRAYCARALRLIQGLAPPKRNAVITAEARQLYERLTRAGVSKRRACALIATILTYWHGLANDALTREHISARLQVRAKPRSPR
jgi:hypothetical protein